MPSRLARLLQFTIGQFRTSFNYNSLQSHFVTNMVLEDSDIEDFADHLLDTGASFALDGNMSPNDTDMLKDDTTSSLFNRLIRAWLNERSAPEILPYQLEILQDLREQLDNQEIEIEERTEGASDPFVRFLYQQEIERIRFVIRSYLRIRMNKIEKFSTFILADDQQRFNLSPEELEYTRKFNALIERYFQKSLLSKLPEPLQALDDPEMVEKPDLESATICRILNHTGRLSLRNGDVIDMEPGHVYIIRYNDIRQLLDMGAVELL